MKLIITVLISLLSFSSYSQNTKVTKKNLKRIFSQNANGKLFNWEKKNWDNSLNDAHLSKYKVWQITNEDSSYYKSDTLVLYNYQYAYFKIKSNKIKEWHFHKKNKIVVSDFDSKTALSTAGICCYKLKLEENKGDVFLILFNKKEKFEKFKILDLKIKNLKDDMSKQFYIMTIVRIK